MELHSAIRGQTQPHTPEGRSGDMKLDCQGDVQEEKVVYICFITVIIDVCQCKYNTVLCSSTCLIKSVSLLCVFDMKLLSKHK